MSSSSSPRSEACGRRAYRRSTFFKGVMVFMGNHTQDSLHDAQWQQSLPCTPGSQEYPPQSVDESDDEDSPPEEHSLSDEEELARSPVSSACFAQVGSLEPKEQLSSSISRSTWYGVNFTTGSNLLQFSLE